VRGIGFVAEESQRRITAFYRPWHWATHRALCVRSPFGQRPRASKLRALIRRPRSLVSHVALSPAPLSGAPPTRSDAHSPDTSVRKPDLEAQAGCAARRATAKHGSVRSRLFAGFFARLIHHAQPARPCFAFARHCGAKTPANSHPAAGTEAIDRTRLRAGMAGGVTLLRHPPDQRNARRNVAIARPTSATAL
jgi:hypothetical protein